MLYPSFLHLELVHCSYSSSLFLGANDVANAFATSVGSKALTMKQAIIIASIMEFSGSYLLGGNVASTIMKGITEPSLFIDTPVVFHSYCEV